MPSWSRIAAVALVALSASCSALELGEVVTDFSDVLSGTRDVMDNVTLANSGDLISLAKRACPAQCTAYCCVSDGTCIPSRAWSCCGSGIVCGPGRKCCHNGCINDNEECCRTAGRHCDAGLECWLINGVPKCCPPGVCGSGGGGGGNPRPTPPPSPSSPPNRPSFDYYTWTVTWRYYVTFYTSVTIRTSTTTTTTSLVSFYASNSADASSSFRKYSATATFTPPASATNVPEPPSGGSGGSGGSGAPGGGNLVALPPGESGSSGIWSWHAALLAGAALVPGLLAVYL
ncbi:hypothetical protein GX51_04535 [Blastomyces parvus]|uniref:GPI anchored protein n=1 Tax=Blastomyces parvus TaxID=2060905 RepID=A0A2B7X1P5_9EURO|nr:hypothetical protein GX51_04535 [Blastomyces parvus]